MDVAKIIHRTPMKASSRAYEQFPFGQ